MTFKKSNDPKQARVEIRLSATEKAAIANLAHDAGETVASYMLKASLKRPIRNQRERIEANELRLTILALKEMYHDGIPAKDERLTPLLEAALAALLSKVGKVSKVSNSNKNRKELP